jgi:uncharacterized membrane protein YvlD (DUF360 family)
MSKKPYRYKDPHGFSVSKFGISAGAISLVIGGISMLIKEDSKLFPFFIFISTLGFLYFVIDSTVVTFRDWRNKKRKGKT